MQSRLSERAFSVPILNWRELPARIDGKVWSRTHIILPLHGQRLIGVLLQRAERRADTAAVVIADQIHGTRTVFGLRSRRRQRFERDRRLLGRDNGKAVGRRERRLVALWNLAVQKIIPGRRDAGLCPDLQKVGDSVRRRRNNLDSPFVRADKIYARPIQWFVFDEECLIGVSGEHTHRLR